MAEMTHAELVAAIKTECRRRRLPCYDTQTTSWSHESAGWVDLVILGRGSALFVEVKKQDGRRTQRQREVGNELAAAGLFYRCWRPDDHEAGLIAKTLDELAIEQRRAAAAWQPARVIGPSFDPDGPGYEVGR